MKEKFRRRREARGRRRQGGDEVGRRVASGEGGARAHFRQDVDEVVQTRQVAVLPVPFLPRDVVLQGLALGQGRGFPKVDHPHLGLFLLVVDEEEGAADDLEGSRGVRQGKGRGPALPSRQQAGTLGGLGKKPETSGKWSELCSADGLCPPFSPERQSLPEWPRHGRGTWDPER